MKDARAIVLAAGEGTRMLSSRSKVLHGLFGKTIIEHVVDALRRCGITDVTVVAGKNLEDLKLLLNAQVHLVLQTKRLGTGHAVQCCESWFKGFKGHTVVLAGDAPLILGTTLADFIKRHAAESADASILTAELENPQGYGRILRDYSGHVSGIREDLDASPLEREIKEINSGIYVFQTGKLFESLKEIKPANSKKEYYLTDVIGVFVKKQWPVKAYPLAKGDELLGINTRKDMAEATRVLWKRNIDFQLERGVTVVSPENTYIESGVRIGRDTVIHPFSHIEKDVTIGKNCQIGPFCKIRSGSRIKDGAVVGSFVEVVRSTVGEKSMVKHLTYLGDAEVGKGVNIGAGTITANYDGKNKNKTRIGDGAFIGCDTILIAPVSVGKKAKTGAGSVVPRGKNVPARSTVAGVPAKILSKNQ